MGGGDFFSASKTVIVHICKIAFIDNLNFCRKNFRFLFCRTVRHTTHNHGHLLHKHS